MKKLIDGDLSKFITSFGCPIVCIDFSEDITWGRYMEIYNLMKDCAENRKPVMAIYYSKENGKLDAENIEWHIGIPTKVDDSVEEGSYHYNFYFSDPILEICNTGEEYVITTTFDWACGFRPNDPADLEHKGLGKIEEWL